MKFTFVLRGDGGALDPFVQAYKKFNKAIGAGDKARAEDQLSRMQVTNLYEEAYKNLATFAFHTKWGDETQQLRALRAAVAEEGRARYLPEKTFAAALQALLPLELKAQEFASFLKTWEKVQKSAADEALLATWEATVEDVQKLRTDERSYRVHGRIEAGTSWFYRLHKRRFRAFTKGLSRFRRMYIRPYAPHMHAFPRIPELSNCSRLRARAPAALRPLPLRT
jgi:hypothetical protein